MPKFNFPIKISTGGVILLLAFSSLLFLFLPDKTLTSLGLLEYREPLKSTLTVIGVALGILLILFLIIYWVGEKRERKSVFESFSHLDLGEAVILKFMIENNMNSITASPSNQFIASLLDKKILYRVSASPSYQIINGYGEVRSTPVVLSITDFLKKEITLESFQNIQSISYDEMRTILTN